MEKRQTEGSACRFSDSIARETCRLQRSNLLIGACQYMEAAGDSLADLLEIAIAQVEQQFLDRPTDLDPWMAPGIIAIHALLIGHILDDIVGMAQRKLYLVALHGELTTHTAWQRLESRIVGYNLYTAFTIRQMYKIIFKYPAN